MTGWDAKNMDMSRYEAKEKTFEEWISYGISRGWCGPPVCYTHDGLPTTPSEDDEWENGMDPCIHVIRMYESEEMKNQIEENHSPSMWRNSYKTN